MARIRTIKPEFCSSADAGALTREARLFFLQLLTEADDEGRLLWIPRRLCGVLYPHDDDVSPAMLRAWAAQCVDRKMLVIYVIDGIDHIQVVNWERHQKISHPSKSRLPAFSGNLPESIPKVSGESPEGLRPDLGTGKGKEQGIPAMSSTSSKDPPPVPTSEPADLSVRRAERIASITDDAISAYNALLGKPKGLLSAVHPKVGRTKRREQVRRVLTIASEICEDQFGDKRISPDFWQAYFGACDADPWMRGDGPYAGTHANWRPDFEFLTRPATMLKVFERETADEAGAA